MMNWQETGYVPDSDGDISDAELSTQEDPVLVGGDKLEEAYGVEEKDKEEEEEEGEAVALVSWETNAIMNDAADGEYLSLEQEMAIPSSGTTRVGRRLSSIGLRTSHHEEPDLQLEPEMGGDDGVPVVDLSNQMGDSPHPQTDRNAHGGKGNQGDGNLGSSPDPIARGGEGSLGNRKVVYILPSFFGR
jgi:hypothetical protein